MRVNFVLPGMNLSGGTRVVLMPAEHVRHRGGQPLVIAPPPPPARLRRRLGPWVGGTEKWQHWRELGVDVAAVVVPWSALLLLAWLRFKGKIRTGAVSAPAPKTASAG
jgi:hypothetical protein